MGCSLTINPQGQVTAIVCSRGRKQYCKWCGRPSNLLCDYPVKRKGKDTTCDARICQRCATSIPERATFGSSPLPDNRSGLRFPRVT